MQPKPNNPDLAAILEQFKNEYAEALKRLGRFNLIIFGESGVGKSTLVNAMFGLDIAHTGIGRPVTQETIYYEHPSGIFGVYDSKGVEVGVAGDHILKDLKAVIAEQQSKPLSERIHVVWYAVKSGDRFYEPHANFVRHLVATELPVILVMTQVSVRDGAVHPDAEALAESILEWDLPVRPEKRVYFTMAKADEFDNKPAYGLPELLDATFRVAPEGARAAFDAVQRIDPSRKVARARKEVALGAAAAAAAAAIPVPFSDAATLVPIQVAMMAKVAVTFGLDLHSGTLATLAGAALSIGGVTQAGKWIVANLLELIPGGNVAGAMINASVASTLTYAIGGAWIVVCGQLAELDPETAERLTTKQIREMFKAAYKARRDSPEASAE